MCFRTITYTLLLILIGFILKYCVPYGVYHRVKKGETLYSIAKTYGVSVKEIVEINNISDPSMIKEGQVIFIPGARTEKHPEMGEKPQAARNVPVKKEGVSRKESQPPSSEEFKGVEGINFIWPVDGEIISGFGIRNGVPHDGIDIKAPEGTPIRAAYDGKVIYSGDELKGYGNLIIIKHPGDYATVYAHNRINYVRDGDFVRKGQIIGEVGKTGNATTPHLHFEIRWKAKPQNPVLLLPPQDK